MLQGSYREVIIVSECSAVEFVPLKINDVIFQRTEKE
jgi:hypothetical protein